MHDELFGIIISLFFKSHSKFFSLLFSIFSKTSYLILCLALNYKDSFEFKK